MVTPGLNATESYAGHSYRSIYLIRRKVSVSDLSVKVYNSGGLGMCRDYYSASVILSRGL